MSNPAYSLPTNTPYGTFFPSSYVPYGPGGLYAPYGGGPYSGGIDQQMLYNDLFRRYQNVQNTYNYNNQVNNILKNGLPGGPTDIINYYNQNYYGYGGYSGGNPYYPYSYLTSYSPPEVVAPPQVVTTPPALAPGAYSKPNGDVYSTSGVLLATTAGPVASTPPPAPTKAIELPPPPVQLPPPVVAPIQSTYQDIIDNLPPDQMYGASIITQAPGHGVPVTYTGVDGFGNPIQYTVYL